MPELPDIVVLAESLNQALVGKTIHNVQVNQPKVLNTSIPKFRKILQNQQFRLFRQRGKWILSELESDWVLAFNLGMGGELRLHYSLEVPDAKRERVIFFFKDGNQLWAHFWWFGHIHLLKTDDLSKHAQIGTLGIEPLSVEFSIDKLNSLLSGKRGRIKNYLLNQRFIAGIGNVYVQDILWHARLHPSRNANSLSATDVEQLHYAIQHVLQSGIKFGPGPGEQDVWGNQGDWGKQPGWPKIAYKTEKPCPICETQIEEIRIGSTTSYICPRCQI